MGHRPRPALLQGQPGLGTVKGLNLTLLIDAEDDRLLGRVEVEPGDILQLRQEVRIAGELKRLLAVWLEAVLLPDALDRRFLSPVTAAIVRVLHCVALSGVRWSVR